MVKLNKIIILVAAASLAGCQSNKDDLKTFISGVQSQATPQVMPVPVMKTYESFTYSASELRNPFVPTVIDVIPEEAQITDNGIRPDRTRLKEPLESYGLEELQLVGSLQKEDIWALIRAPEGVIHRVKIGDYMGKNHGKILSISDSELIVKEIVEDGSGGYLKRDTSLSVVDVN